MANGWSYRVPREGAEEVIADTPFTFSFYDIQDPPMEWGCLHSVQAFPARRSPT